VTDQHPELVQRAKQIFTEAHMPSELWKFRSLAGAPEQ